MHKLRQQRPSCHRDCPRAHFVQPILVLATRLICHRVVTRHVPGSTALVVMWAHAGISKAVGIVDQASGLRSQV